MGLCRYGQERNASGGWITVRSLNVKKHLIAIVALFILAFSACGADDEVQIALNFKGKPTDVKYVKGTIDGKEVEVAVVNGFITDEFLEGEDLKDGKWIKTFRSFRFEGKIKYDKDMKLVYTYQKNGPSITEEVSDAEGKVEEVRKYRTRIYSLKVKND